MAKTLTPRKPRAHKHCACYHIKPTAYTPEDRARSAEADARMYSERARANAYREAMLILTGQYKSQPLPY